MIMHRSDQVLAIRALRSAAAGTASGSARGW